jgi:hypothetical protein
LGWGVGVGFGFGFGVERRAHLLHRGLGRCELLLQRLALGKLRPSRSGSRLRLAQGDGVRERDEHLSCRRVRVRVRVGDRG